MRDKQNKPWKQESTFYFRCHMTDPIARLLIDRLQMSPIKFAGIGLALGLGYAVLVRLGSEQQSLIYHWDSLLFGIIFIPIIAFAYIWIIATTTQIMQQLHQQGPSMKDGTFFDYLSRIQQLFNRRSWTVLSIILSTINALFWGILLIKPDGQAHEYGWLILISRIVAACLIFIFSYIVAMTLIRGVLTMLAVKRLVIDVAPEYDPFHSDGWAGFTPIGEFAVRMFYILAVAVSGIVAFTVETSQNLVVFPAYIGLCYLLYIVAIAVLIIAPIMFVRNYLRKQKEKSIQQLTSYTRSLYQSLISTKYRDVRDVSLFTELMLARKAIESFPEWPTNFRNLWRMLSIIVGAVMPLVVSLLPEWLSSLLV